MEELFRRTESTAGYKLNVDLPSQSVRDDQRFDAHFDIEPFRKQVLLEGLDDIGMTLKQAPAIAAYEASHKPALTLYGSVDFSKPAAN